MPPTGDEVVAEEDCLDGVLGFEVVSIGDGEAVARFPIRDRVRQRFGLVHGGAYAALAEMLATEATVAHGEARDRLAVADRDDLEAEDAVEAVVLGDDFVAGRRHPYRQRITSGPGSAANRASTIAARRCRAARWLT